MSTRLALLLGCVFFMLPSMAEEVVTACTEQALVDAIRNGGTIRFACDGIISISKSISIASNLEIDATGRRIILDGGGTNRIFELTDARASFKNLIFSNGVAKGMDAIAPYFGTEPNAPAGPGLGGAIKIYRSSVFLSDCSFIGNRAVGGDGAGNDSCLEPWVRHNGENAFGGSIFAEDAELTIQNCFWLNNAAVGGNGGLYIYCSKPYVSQPGNAYGGAVWTKDSLIQIRNSRFLKCSAGATDTGTLGPATEGSMGGGAIATEDSKLQVIDSVFFENSASSLTGGGGTATGGAISCLGGEALVEASTFVLNSAVGGRGGRAGQIIDSDRLTGGGAVWASNNLSIHRSTFLSNCVRGGSASSLDPRRPPGSGAGGAVLSLSSSTIANSTFGFNVITGGYMFNYGIYPAGNTYGGAIYVSNHAVIAHSTLVSNRLVTVQSNWWFGRGFSYGAGIYATNHSLRDASVRVEASILVGNLPDNFSTGMAAMIKDGGANISSDSSLEIQTENSLAGAEPGIAPLTSFGNHFFFPLLPGSPAIDRARALPSASSLDQVSFPRTNADSGAIEWQGLEPRLALVFLEDGALVLSVRDPSYLARLFESRDLDQWTIHTLSNFAPISLDALARERGFFRIGSTRFKRTSKSP